MTVTLTFTVKSAAAVTSRFQVDAKILKYSAAVLLCCRTRAAGPGFGRHLWPRSRLASAEVCEGASGGEVVAMGVVLLVDFPIVYLLCTLCILPGARAAVLKELSGDTRYGKIREM
jgi:hypothetical protein